jgi:hypothetical protein
MSNVNSATTRPAVLSYGTVVRVTTDRLAAPLHEGAYAIVLGFCPQFARPNARHDGAFDYEVVVENYSSGEQEITGLNAGDFEIVWTGYPAITLCWCDKSESHYYHHDVDDEMYHPFNGPRGVYGGRPIGV